VGLTARLAAYPWAVATGDGCEWKRRPADLRGREGSVGLCRESKAPIGSLSAAGYRQEP
jgi:hypothetical protein